MKNRINSGLRNLLPIVPGMLLLILSRGVVSAQQADNPRMDQVPRELRRQAERLPGVPSSGDVITINNWDNYVLGTDYAESSLAVHPANPAWFFTAYNINATHHTENGMDWQTQNPSWTNMAGDPAVAYDNAGNLFYINLYGDPIESAKVVRSTTNGQTWEAPVVAANGDDKCWISCDQTNGPYGGYVYVTMNTATSGYFARSRDHGQTFENTVNFGTETLPGMMTCVGPYNNVDGGSVIVVTNSGDPFASAYTFYRSINGGASFTMMSTQQFAGYVGTDVNGRNSVEGMRTRPYPLIAMDNSAGPNRGRLYCVYATNDPPGNGNRPDVWCRYSVNGGTTWSEAKRVNDDMNPQANHQYHPAVWCDRQNGRLYIQWMDTRDTPAHDSACIYATYSDDGGQSFKANQRISNQKMKIDCPTCGGSGIPRYQGDYNAIVSNRKVSLAGWTDFRNGTFLSLTAYFPDFALALDKSADSLMAPSDSTDILVSVPGVKLYTDTVLLSGAVTPVPATGSLVVTFPGGNRITGFPGSRTARILVSGMVPLGYYSVAITAQGPNGTPVHVRELTLRVKSTEYITVSANAIPPAVCPGSSSQLMANVQGGVGSYTYNWYPVTGLSNPSVRNPVASPVVTTWYHVQVNDEGGHSSVDSVLVTILHVPSSAGPIIGPDTVCRNTAAVFHVEEVAGATSYSWTVPAGVVINSGQNTTLVEVTWGSSNGIISVIAGNECGNSVPSVLSVKAISVPQTPEEIIGPDSICQSTLAIFSVAPVTDASSYLWTVPAESNIIEGQNTPSIKVAWGGEPGQVGLTVGNKCGDADPVTKPTGTWRLPAEAGEITGKDTVCLNHPDIVYSVAPIADAYNYVWEVPSGADITGGEGSMAIRVNFGPDAVSGDVTVHGINSCGTGTGSVKAVTVKNCEGVENPGREPGFGIGITGEILRIRSAGSYTGVEISLCNAVGKCMVAERLPDLSPGSEEKIDVSRFSGGLYILQIRTYDRIFVRKILLP